MSKKLTFDELYQSFVALDAQEQLQTIDHYMVRYSYIWQPWCDKIYAMATDQQDEGTCFYALKVDAVLLGRILHGHSWQEDMDRVKGASSAFDELLLQDDYASLSCGDVLSTNTLKILMEIGIRQVEGALSTAERHHYFLQFTLHLTLYRHYEYIWNRDQLAPFFLMARHANQHTTGAQIDAFLSEIHAQCSRQFAEK